VKPIFRQAPPKYIAQSAHGKTASTFSGRLVALPQSQATGGNYAPRANHSNQATTLVTTNQHPIPASISLTRAGPPPLIPARAISGTPNPKSVQILRPRIAEGKIAAAPNVCVTERGTFVATQLNKTSVPTTGACVMNHVVGQSPDANAMMNKMFSVVRGSENGVPTTVVANVSRTQTPQVAHVHPSVQNERSHQNTNSSHQNTNNSHQNTSNSHQSTNNSHQNTINSHQNTNNSHQNTNNSHQNTNNSHQNTNITNQNTNITNQNTRRPNQNTSSSYQNTNVPGQNTHTYQSANRINNSTVTYDKNANIGSQSTVQKFSLNVGGGMGAVTTAVRSGLLARERYQPPEASRNTKHVITHGGGYTVKINENNLGTKPRIRSTITNIPDRTANQSDISPNASDRIRNQSVITPNVAEVTPTVSEVSPTPSEEIPMLADIATNEAENEAKYLHHVPRSITSKRGSTWMYRRRKKKKVRFTYVKGKKNKKKDESEIQENFEECGAVFEQAFDDGGQAGEHLKRRGRGIKRDHDDGEFENILFIT
jgi:hypothetical protein